MYNLNKSQIKQLEDAWGNNILQELKNKGAEQDEVIILLDNLDYEEALWNKLDNLSQDEIEEARFRLENHLDDYDAFDLGGKQAGKLLDNL